MSDKSIVVSVTEGSIKLTSQGLDPKDVIDTLETIVSHAKTDFLTGKLKEKHDIPKEYHDDLSKQVKEFESFEECFAAYARGRSTTEKAMDKYGLNHGTIPDSVGKILSLVDDEQIKKDLSKMVAGFVLNLAACKPTKKPKKK